MVCPFYGCASWRSRHLGTFPFSLRTRHLGISTLLYTVGLTRKRDIYVRRPQTNDPFVFLRVTITMGNEGECSFVCWTYVF
jgi:hypothetical protein